jgi:hypothetical protein
MSVSSYESVEEFTDSEDDDDDEYVECYFCNDLFNKTKKYDSNDYYVSNGVVYCTDCSPNLHIEIMDPVRCSLCSNTKKSVKLVNILWGWHLCDHSICIKCYKEIYFGYTDEPRPLTLTEFYNENPRFNLNAPLWSDNTDFWTDYNYYINKYMKQNSIKIIEEIDIDTFKMNIPNIDYRPWWLENAHYTEWELDYIQKKQKLKKVEDDWEEWIKEKDKTITSHLFECKECYGAGWGVGTSASGDI